MPKTKTLREREAELQLLMAYGGGRGELRGIADRYCDAGAGPFMEGTSVIAYIIAHEREKGLIVG